MTAAPAAYAHDPTTATSTTAAATTAAGKETVAGARYLADRLRENPVYVSDQMPRELPRSAAPGIARTAQRTGVPTFVLALPRVDYERDAPLLQAVHELLGRPGLYVLLHDDTVSEAQAYGVDVRTRDARDAAFATSYELPSDASAEDAFLRFTEILTSGKAKERYEAAEATYGIDSDVEPEAMNTTYEQRENQTLTVGIVLGAVPLLLLVLIPYVRHWRSTLPAAGDTRTRR
ncbi:hypothetical protein OG883_01525 [Streptomyces sp. NBC_01142]|uniref:hypothetical protein n=1 Tax=Streptomyces sp. NBC_01142 TaxID=2975865 RepID=UPI002252B8C7|nr:hypothetical protein [Streptomyces sp. NBC_01142]MCX4818607.1 hypothetical protein [Streptomyces sp. NBC_01142]